MAIATPTGADRHGRLRWLGLALLALLLPGACTTPGPTFDTAGVDRRLTPRDVAARPGPAEGQTVQWGGLILGATNLRERTRLEVMAYPLDHNARPLTDRAPQGRFFLEQDGFLEPATYAEGREITAIGTVAGTRTAQVGEAEQVYPRIEARQLYLWPAYRGNEGVGGYIGIGIGGGGTDFGSGIGIGF